MNELKKVLIVAKCNVNSFPSVALITSMLVLIVAKCNVNLAFVGLQGIQK